jgi:Na+-driven multidrug efflux pump
MMDVMSGLLRGMGSSFIPMLICLVGACGTRVLWVNTIFKMEGNHTFKVLFSSYPVSWVLTVTAQLIFFAYLYRKIVHPKRKHTEEDLL